MGKKDDQSVMVNKMLAAIDGTVDTLAKAMSEKLKAHHGLSEGEIAEMTDEEVTRLMTDMATADIAPVDEEPDEPVSEPVTEEEPKGGFPWKTIGYCVAGAMTVGGIAYGAYRIFSGDDPIEVAETASELFG